MFGSHRFTSLAGGLFAASLCATLASCSASTGTAGASPPAGTGGAPHMGSGSAPATGNVGNGSGGVLIGGGGDTGIIVVESGGNQGVGGAGCNKEVHQGERQPLDMYFLVDQSGSMAEGNPSKWAAVSSALTSFFADPANSGTGAGIGYFPLTMGGGSMMPSTCTMATNGMNGCICILGFCIDTMAVNFGGSCTGSDYSMPAVPIQLLPGVAPMLQMSLQSHGPGGGTPTYPALQGAYQYATGWAKANLGRRTVFVLATDGEPTGCGNTNNVQQIATDLVAPALAGNPPLSTFVIGVGNSLNSLNQLAMAGGTKQAFIVDTGGDVAKQFAMALDAIRGQAASCNFAIKSDGTVDPTKVNASYTPVNGAPVDLFGVPDQNGCTANGNYWYYNADKTQIILCPYMCQTLSQMGGSVQVVLGCPTNPPIVK